MLRCRICGETYLGSDAPSRCPFCGAASEYFVEPGVYSASMNDIQPTELERSDLETAIELERSNTRYYLAMSRMSGDETLASTYKRLSRIEAEHCSLFCKLLDIPKPADLDEPEGQPDSWCDSIAESARRERRAASFYADVVTRCTNERLCEVFEAVAAVERDHLDLDDAAAVWAGCESR